MDQYAQLYYQTFQVIGKDEWDSSKDSLNEEQVQLLLDNIKNDTTNLKQLALANNKGFFLLSQVNVQLLQDNKELSKKK